MSIFSNLHKWSDKLYIRDSRFHFQTKSSYELTINSKKAVNNIFQKQISKCSRLH